MATETERKTDIGPPHYEQFLPPVIKKNYGKWKQHEIPRPGVLVHTAESGDKLYSVRAASPRLMSIKGIRAFADLADTHTHTQQPLTLLELDAAAFFQKCSQINSNQRSPATL